MNFISTRDINNQKTASFAIKNGISQEGGLFVPVKLKKFTKEELNNLVSLDYQSLSLEILKNLLDDFTEDEVKMCVDKAYTDEKFGKDKTPVVKLDNSKFVLELWHGPTCAFKDMALQILPFLTEVAINKSEDKKNALILVATSGDTGKAALEGFCNVPKVKIMVFYPKDGVSDIQKLQMTTQDGENVSVCGIDGNFDDAQTAVKKIFTDEQIKQKVSEKGFFFSSANSINWGRLAPQVIYYFKAYLSLVNSNDIKMGDEINFVVPTGNFGNILAGYYAKKMGLPIAKLICASNKNNILTDFINTGIYDKNRSFYQTSSPSMDILISSNLERLLFDLCDNDCDFVKKYMSDLNEFSKYEVSAEIKQKLSQMFYADFATEEQTANSISETYKKFGYTIDTHTAVAMYVYDKYKEKTGDETKTIVVSTASVYKFGNSVLRAITGENCDNIDEFMQIKKLNEICKIEVPKSLTELKDKKIKYPTVYNKENLKDVVLEFIK